MRVLIAGACYLDSQPKRYLAELWARTMRLVNPDAHLLIINPASPLPDPDWPAGTQVLRFPENVGHLSFGGLDGSGRSYVESIREAIEGGYSHALLTETDILLARPVRPIFDAMQKSGVVYATPFEPAWSLIENGLNFADVNFLCDANLAGRYDWRNSTLAELPERKVERLVGDRLFLLPLRGCRNDMDVVTSSNLTQLFPFGCDYITHCADFAVYRAFLRMNGLPDE